MKDNIGNGAAEICIFFITCDSSIIASSMLLLQNRSFPPNFPKIQDIESTGNNEINAKQHATKHLLYLNPISSATNQHDPW